MKVMLISENEESLCKADDFLRQNHYDTIIYHQILKALDNIQEISPDYLVINVSNYPRHWKVMVQFIKNCGLRSSCKVILVIPEDFSEEELKKAEALGISGSLENIEQNGLDKLKEIIEGSKPAVKKTEKAAPVKGSLLARIEALNGN